MDFAACAGAAGGLLVQDRLHEAETFRLLFWEVRGQLGKIDRQRGTFEPVAFFPGYLRGMAFVGNYAVVGLSRPRHDKTFDGLALEEALTAKGAEARCGLHVVDLDSGDTAHWLRLGGMVSELYDVIVLPGAVRPMALGFKTDEIQRLLTVGGPGVL